MVLILHENAMRISKTRHMPGCSINFSDRGPLTCGRPNDYLARDVAMLFQCPIDDKVGGDGSSRGFKGYLYESARSMIRVEMAANLRRRAIG